MKAAVLTGCRCIETREVSEPVLDPDGVVLRVEAAAICNATDYRIYCAADPVAIWPSQPWPTIMGHEICGRVIAVGSNVQGWWEGDRLAAWCPGFGGYAEYCQVYPTRLAAMHVAETWPADQAAVLELAIGTLRYLADAPGLCKFDGARVVVIGLGPSGLLYVQYARLLGAREIFVVDRNLPRRELATQLGATAVFESLDELTASLDASGQPADAVLDTSGADLRDSLTGRLRQNSMIVPFGVGFDWTNVRQVGSVPIRVVTGSGINEARAVLPHLNTWIDSGKLDIASLISRHIGLDDIGLSLEALQQHPKHLVKVVVVPG